MNQLTMDAATHAGAVSSNRYNFITWSPRRFRSSTFPHVEKKSLQKSLRSRNVTTTKACKQLILHTGSHVMRVNRLGVCWGLLSGLVSY